VKKRKGDPWMPADAYGRTLGGLSANLLVRDVARSVPFYRDVLGFAVHYADVDFAALERDGMHLQLHADHTYDAMPWYPELTSGVRRGLGAELRILGIDPDAVEQRARASGATVLLAAGDRRFGWRDVIVADPDGYTFAVGVAT